MRDKGVLVPVSGQPLLRFTQDYPFDSPFAAAAVVADTPLNGRVYWKLKGDGTTYKDWQERQVTGAVGAKQD